MDDTAGETASARTLHSRWPDLAHEAEDVLVRVAEECKPEVVVGHAGDQMRRLYEIDSLCGQMRVDGWQVFNREVEDGATAGRIRVFRAQREADVAALEEDHGAGIEQEAHAERALVEVAGAGDVGNSKGDLADFLEVD